MLSPDNSCCLLLDVIQSPALGTVVYKSSFKANAESRCWSGLCADHMTSEQFPFKAVFSAELKSSSCVKSKLEGDKVPVQRRRNSGSLQFHMSSELRTYDSDDGFHTMSAAGRCIRLSRRHSWTYETHMDSCDSCGFSISFPQFYNPDDEDDEDEELQIHPKM